MYIYIYMYTYIHIDIHTYIHMCTYAHIYIHTYLLTAIPLPTLQIPFDTTPTRWTRKGMHTGISRAAAESCIRRSPQSPGAKPNHPCGSLFAAVMRYTFIQKSLMHSFRRAQYIHSAEPHVISCLNGSICRSQGQNPLNYALNVPIST